MPLLMCSQRAAGHHHLGNSAQPARVDREQSGERQKRVNHICVPAKQRAHKAPLGTHEQRQFQRKPDAGDVSAVDDLDTGASKFILERTAGFESEDLDGCASMRERRSKRYQLPFRTSYGERPNHEENPAMAQLVDVANIFARPKRRPIVPTNVSRSGGLPTAAPMVTLNWLDRMCGRTIRRGAAGARHGIGAPKKHGPRLRPEANSVPSSSDAVRPGHVFALRRIRPRRQGRIAQPRYAAAAKPE
jgi:hypothetical protein